MGRKPSQEPIKEYLENDRTRFLYASPAEYRELFGDMSEKYLTRATGKKNPLGPKTFRVVVHLPNKEHNNREEYMAKLKKGDGWLWNTFLKPNAPLYRSRIRWDAGSYHGAHLRLGRKGRGYLDYYLTPSTNPKGGVVNGQITFPTADRTWVPLKANTTNKKAVTKADGSKGYWRRGTKLVACRVTLGTFNVSASKKDQFKLTLGNPEVRCPKGLVDTGKAPIQFSRGWEPTVADGTMNPDDVEVTILPLNAEEYGAETVGWFYEAQGYDNLLEIQDVEIMDSETEQQANERAYYNPSDAMVGTDETLSGYRPIDSATVDLTSNQPMANYGAEGRKRMMCAECGSYDVKEAEGETATYAPSNEPDMVSSSSFDNPTNANYSAEGETVADVESSVEPANEPLAVAEGTSLNGYAPLDSLEEGAPIGHGVNQYFGSAETVEGALLDESTTGITIEEGVSLEGFSGVDSVVVEAPLGHGVTQWYAEDSPEPEFDAGITGQDGPSADPTNSNFSAQGYDDKMDESMGMRDGTESSMEQSMKDRRDEASAMDKMHSKMHRKYDDVMTMDADSRFDKLQKEVAREEMKDHPKMSREKAMDIGGGVAYDAGVKKYGPEVMAEAARKGVPAHTLVKEAIEFGRGKDGRFKGRMYVRDNKKGSFLRQGADTAGYLQDGSLSMDGYTPLESVEVDRTSFQPTQNYGAEFEADGITGEKPFTAAVKVGSGFGVGLALSSVLLGAAAALSMGLVGTLMGGSETTE